MELDLFARTIRRWRFVIFAGLADGGSPLLDGAPRTLLEGTLDRFVEVDVGVFFWL